MMTNGERWRMLMLILGTVAAFSLQPYILVPNAPWPVVWIYFLFLCSVMILGLSLLFTRVFAFVAAIKEARG